jgi:hypothetical protein
VSGPPKAKCGPAIVRDSIEVSSARTRVRAEGGSEKRHSYKPLPKEFQRDGFTYRQITRARDVAIYTQVWNGCPDPAVCFEVIRVKRRAGFEINSRFVEPAEVYPNSEAWGTDGFSFTNKDAAFVKLHQLA